MLIYIQTINSDFSVMSVFDRGVKNNSLPQASLRYCLFMEVFSLALFGRKETYDLIEAGPMSTFRHADRIHTYSMGTVR
jgi:hypothetical protein